VVETSTRIFRSGRQKVVPDSELRLGHVILHHGKPAKLKLQRNILCQEVLLHRRFQGPDGRWHYRQQHGYSPIEPPTNPFGKITGYVNRNLPYNPRVKVSVLAAIPIEHP
jgi:hypothetical protein